MASIDKSNKPKQNPDKTSKKLIIIEINQIAIIKRNMTEITELAIKGNSEIVTKEVEKDYLIRIIKNKQ